jgi:hypothetical protein
MNLGLLAAALTVYVVSAARIAQDLARSHDWPKPLVLRDLFASNLSLCSPTHSALYWRARSAHAGGGMQRHGPEWKGDRRTSLRDFFRESAASVRH